MSTVSEIMPMTQSAEHAPIPVPWQPLPLQSSMPWSHGHGGVKDRQPGPLRPVGPGHDEALASPGVYMDPTPTG